MTAQKLDKAILWYLGYNPGEDVKKVTAGQNGDAYISEWDVQEDQPTQQELQTAYDDNILEYLKTHGAYYEPK